jgi:tetratricopeptide (TPR) repeat protein
MEALNLPRISVTRVLSHTFALALEHHRAGRIDEAAELYREIRAIDPSDADALFLLGVIARQKGQLDQSSTLIRKAISLFPYEERFGRELDRVHVLQHLARRAAKSGVSDLFGMHDGQVLGSFAAVPQPPGSAPSTRGPHIAPRAPLCFQKMNPSPHSRYNKGDDDATRYA